MKRMALILAVVLAGCGGSTAPESLATCSICTFTIGARACAVNAGCCTACEVNTASVSITFDGRAGMPAAALPATANSTVFQYWANYSSAVSQTDADTFTLTFKLQDGEPTTTDLLIGSAWTIGTSASH